MAVNGSAQHGPRIERVNAKIGSLERRLAHLEDRVRMGDKPRQRSFDEAEAEALRAGIAALRYHRAALDAETDPVLALSELVDTVSRAGLIDDTQPGGLADAMRRAKRVLRDLEE